MAIAAPTRGQVIAILAALKQSLDKAKPQPKAERDGRKKRVEHRREISTSFSNGAPGPPDSGRFVEVENDKRQSLELFGEWLQRSDGFWKLRITAADLTQFLVPVCLGGDGPGYGFAFRRPP